MRGRAGRVERLLGSLVRFEWCVLGGGMEVEVVEGCEGHVCLVYSGGRRWTKRDGRM